MKAPIQRVHICAYCTRGTHIIDTRTYPNDVIATKDKLGWKCGNCIERR
jgi:hypothetical protein